MGRCSRRLSARVIAPVFLGYYYRDEQHQDPTVSVAAMLAMYDRLGTPPTFKRKQDFPDAGAHVISFVAALAGQRSGVCRQP